MPKKRFPLSKVYGLLEPGPVVLLTTARGSRSNVMTMSWHSMLEFEPPLVGCVVSDRGFSHSLLRTSKECVLNIPTEEIVHEVVGCGNTTGAKVDKFAKFGLSRSTAKLVSAPLIDECFASLECRITDARMVRKYSFFVLEVICAWVDPKVKTPRTLHHRGYGSFMVAGQTVKVPSKMR
jgi:flavin reductase (DIM6/NTAB) family NADH-FMN oxidoreductase RutF